LSKILVTNDAGVTSPGLWALNDALKEVGDPVVIAPDSHRSATGMSLTFHKPLRLKRVRNRKREAYTVSGNTADCVFLGIIELFKKKPPSLVASGINLGDNLTTQLVFASSTVAGAIEGAVIGAPAVAFSLSLPEDRKVRRDELTTKLKLTSLHVRRIAKWVMDNRLPTGVDCLNVNFPFEITQQTPAKITTLGIRKYNDEIVKRTDPSGHPYFWQWGRTRDGREFLPGTDIYTVFVEKMISITPLKLDASVPAGKELEALLRSMATPES
jgi:5'-nucleotidase